MSARKRYCRYSPCCVLSLGSETATLFRRDKSSPALVSKLVLRPEPLGGEGEAGSEGGRLEAAGCFRWVAARAGEEREARSFSSTVIEALA